MGHMLGDVGMAAGLGVLVIMAILIAVIGTIGLVLRGLLAVLSMVFRPRRRHGSAVTASAFSAGAGPESCINALCGHVNSPSARYCAKCGRRLRLAGD